MRPKTVILTLVVAIGLVAVAAVLKGIYATAPQPPPGPVAPELAKATNTNAQVPPVKPNVSNPPAITEQQRAEEVARELDQVRELQAAGWVSSTTTSLLLHKVMHPEPEVSKAAIEALKQLDATDAVPGLKQALGVLKDPRIQVLVMDAIEYLELQPTGSPTVPPEAAGEAGDGNRPRSAVKPEGAKGASSSSTQPGSRDSSRRAAVPPATTAAQPVSPAPGRAAPQ
jgi:hypothetical protein